MAVARSLPGSRKRVGPTGFVLVTDIDTRFLEAMHALSAASAQERRADATGSIGRAGTAAAGLRAVRLERPSPAPPAIR